MKVQQSLKIAHTSSVAISLVINGLLVMALLLFITFDAQNVRDTSTVMVIDPVDQEMIDEIEEEIEPEELVDPDELDQLTDFSMEMELDTQFEEESTTVESPVEMTSLTDLMSDVSSPVVMSGLLVGRTARARAAAAQRYGRGFEKFSEPAVLKALEWLRDHQHQNGSWTKNGDTTGRGSNAGYTGLALLTFLAHGETPSSADFGPTVARGIRFLIENQASDGVFQPAGAHTGYGHAMATYAIAEAYTMTENPLLREPLERAVEVIIKGQMPNGGYDYDYKKEDRNDLSISAWHLQALKAATISDAGSPRMKEYLQKGMDGMMHGAKKNEDGGIHFSYSGGKEIMGGGGARRTVSAAGTLCLFLSGRGESDEAEDAIKYLESFLDSPQLPEWGAEGNNPEHGGLINTWYYTIQAFFQDDPDGKNFRRYMPAMVKALAQNQAPDGHWLCYTDKGINKGKTYNTTLAALGLMVYYRYLPTTQAENIQRATPAQSLPQEAEDEIGFEI